MRAIFRFSLILLFPLVGLIMGCGSDGADGGPDMVYLRTPELDSEKKSVVTEPISILFPSGSERRWKLAVRAVNKDTIENVQVEPQHTFGNYKNATILSMFQNGKEYRREVFEVKPDMLSLIAAGGKDKMVMNPPMVLFKTQSPEGAEYKWEGEITFKGSKAPAQAFSRIHAPAEVVTPAGKFTAYRVDTALTTIIEGRPITFPASRWFVPGVGIVRQNFRVGNATVEKQVISYSGN